MWKKIFSRDNNLKIVKVFFIDTVQPIGSLNTNPRTISHSTIETFFLEELQTFFIIRISNWKRNS